MKLSRPIHLLFALVFVAGIAIAADTPAPAAPPILPAQFAGWHMLASAQISHEPAAADPTNAVILKEFGFADFASATYSRDDGRMLKIRAARFADASGAVGAYLFYLQPGMQREEIGDDKGVSLGQRVLFRRGHIVIDARFSSESPMSGAQLRELAGLLPRPSGSAGSLPPVLSYLPHLGFVENTEKYAMGPAALNALAPAKLADLVDFKASPEVTLGHYTTSSGEATLMLIYYPTPQLAADHLRRIDAAHQRQPGVSSIENAGGFFDRRTGPIVAVAAGPMSDSDARSLLGLVNYEANVTWSEKTDHEVRDLYTLVFNIVILCAIVGGLAIVAGVAFGGIRILMKRLFPNKIFDRPEQMEFISLHLAESVGAGVPAPSALPVDPGKSTSKPG
jgi:hypothetical protein